MVRSSFVSVLVVLVCLLLPVYALAAETETPKIKIGANGSFNHSYDLLIDGNVVYQNAPWDGDACVYWTDAATEFVFDLGKETEIKELLLQVDDNDTYLVQTSLNGIDYQTLITIKPEHGEIVGGMDIMSSDAASPDFIKDLDFKPVKAKFIKLKASEGDDMYSAAEICINHAEVTMIQNPEEKAVEPAIEEPAAAGAPADEPKKDEPKTEDPKKDEPEKEAPKTTK